MKNYAMLLIGVVEKGRKKKKNMLKSIFIIKKEKQEFL